MELVHYPASPPPFSPAQTKPSSKILAWSFLASILINIGIGVGLGFFPLRDSRSMPMEEKRDQILLYRPPVIQPRKPHLFLLPPKPMIQKRQSLPPPIRQTMSKPIVRVAARLVPAVVPHVVSPPPHAVLLLAPPRAAPQVISRPAPTLTPRLSRMSIARHPVIATTPSMVNVAPESHAPQTAALQAPSRGTTPPDATVPQRPAQQAPAPPLSVAQEPVKPTPTPQVAVRQEPVKPANYRDVSSQEAELTDVPQPDTSGVDPATLTGPCVLSFEIDENGRVSNARIKQRSGSSEYDDACLRAIRRARGVPAIQDHIAHAQRCEHTYQAG